MKSERARTRSAVERFWWEACTVALGLFYLYVSLLGTSVWDSTRTLGIVGGVLLIASTALRNSWLILSSVLIGTLPLAILDWWSVVAPALSVAAVSISVLRIRRNRKISSRD